jgi:uncharacterized protein (DUF885 family)
VRDLGGSVQLHRRLLLVMCVPFSMLHAQHTRATPERDANRLATEYLAAYTQRYPEAVSGAEATVLFDNRRSAYAHWNRQEASYLVRVRHAAPRLHADAPLAVTLGVLQEHLEASREFAVCHRELWNVSPVTGWFSEYRGYALQQHVQDDEGRRLALSRWSRLPDFIDTEIVNLRYGLSHGYRAPRVLVLATIEQVGGVMRLPPEQSPFYAAARADTNAPFRYAMDTLAREGIAPALSRYQSFLKNEYLPHARSSVGVIGNPHGAACFRALIRRYTSLPTTAAQLDAEGRRLLARGLERRRESAKLWSGLTGDAARSGAALQNALRADSANTFKSPAEVKAVAEAALQRAWSAAPRWFAKLPDAPLPVVDSMPGADDSDPTAQYVPADRRGGPSRIFVNMSSLLKPGGRLYLERVMFHEGVPGHHFQIALQQEANGHALNRTLFNAAFAEGWAVYASNLADEMKLYSSEVARVPLVESFVDDGLTMLVTSGLHAHGWSREQAVDTMLVYAGAPREEIEQQVDYFIAAPAHALAYPVGARELERLRRKAQAELGERFDIRSFHAMVLEVGPVPLSLLGRRVEQWMRGLE